MKRCVLAVLVFFIFSVLSFAGCAPYLEQTEKIDFIPRFTEDETPMNFSFDGNTVVYDMLENNVRIRYLDDTDIDLFFLKYDLFNPFLAAPDMREAFNMFLVTFVNASDEKIKFNPTSCAIYVNGSYYRGAMDYAEVVVGFRRLAPETDASSFKKSMFSATLDIYPDTSVEGLLVFPSMPRGTKNIVVMVQGILFSGGSYSIPFEFVAR
jgi:hypothetical protein